MNNVNKSIIILISFIVMSCDGNKLKSDLISAKNIKSSTNMLYFINKDTGYLFGERVISSDSISDVQLSSPNFILPSTRWTKIYKTIDGAKSWNLVDSTINEVFSQKSPTYFNGKLYYVTTTFINSRLLSRKLVCFDLSTHKKLVFPQLFDAIDGVSVVNGQVYFWGSKQRIWQLHVTDVNFYNTQSYSIDLFEKVNNEIVDIGNEPYSLSEGNSLYNLKTKEKIMIDAGVSFQHILKKNNSSCTLLGIDKEDNIRIVNYNIKDRKIDSERILKDYTIINNVRSCENLWVAFIGNIKGLFVSYDMLYSTDSGDNWEIHKLQDQEFCCVSNLTDNNIYINNCLSSFERISFK